MTAVQAPPVVQVRVPERSFRHDLRAVKIVWQRDVIRFVRDRPRIAASFLAPLLNLFVFGTGLAPVMAEAVPGVDFRTFIFPGMLVMTVLFTSVFSASSIVFDREYGFLREMLVAPVRREAIVLGKCLGGATVATSQGIVLIALGPLAGVPYDPALLVTLVLELLFLSFGLTAFGVVMAARMRVGSAFMAVSQTILMPLFFLSGAMFPISSLPNWLQVLNRINPLTYAVDPLRRAIFSRLPLTPDAQRIFNSGVTWWGWRVPVALELAIVAVLAAVMLAVAAVEFRKAD